MEEREREGKKTFHFTPFKFLLSAVASEERVNFTDDCCPSAVCETTISLVTTGDGGHRKKKRADETERERGMEGTCTESVNRPEISLSLTAQLHPALAMTNVRAAVTNCLLMREAESQPKKVMVAGQRED